MAPLASATEAARVVLDPVREEAGRGGRVAVAMSGIRFFNRSEDGEGDGQIVEDRIQKSSPKALDDVMVHDREDAYQNLNRWRERQIF